MLIAAVSVLVALEVVTLLFLWLNPRFGARPGGEHLARMQRSPNYRDGKFHNTVPTPLLKSPAELLSMAVAYYRVEGVREPESTLPTLPLSGNDYQSGRRGAGGEVAVTWLGHSAALIEIGGKIILTDPTLAGRPSPVPFAGPRPFSYSHPVDLADLPRIDAMIISHDHFDHLDYDTVRALADRVPVIFTALGVGAHLERFGVAGETIVELDWWEEAKLAELTIVATPARHFSGRALLDRNKTLFASWVISGGEQRVFFGGDSGYFEGFERIGEKYGPFDLTLLECGAYSQYWPTVHMMPEQTARAHQDLRGQVLIPIHWGKYNLSLHSWTEPVVRLLAEAEKLNATVATPMIGQRFAVGEAVPRRKWWE